MSDKEFTLNIVLSICDALVCMLSIGSLCYIAISAGKWWITLFGFIPLALYNNHAIVMVKRGDDNDS